MENVIGMFVNTLAMRNFPSADKEFSDFLNEVRDRSLGAYNNQNYQFEELVNKLNLERDLSRNPLFDTMFVLQNIHNESQTIKDDLKFTEYDMKNGIALFDLMLEASEQDLLSNLKSIAAAGYIKKKQ